MSYAMIRNENHSKPRLCLDIDNVIADTDPVIRRLIKEMSSRQVDLSYIDIKDYDYYRCSDRNGKCLSQEEWLHIHEEFSLLPNILSILPYPNIQQCLNLLSEKYNLHLVTTRMRSARKATVEWLERHEFPPHSLHFVGHREKHIALASFFASVEDDKVQAAAFALTGANSFLLAHPWNLNCSEESVIRIDGWPELLKALMAL